MKCTVISKVQIRILFIPFAEFIIIRKLLLQWNFQNRIYSADGIYVILIRFFCNRAVPLENLGQYFE